MIAAITGRSITSPSSQPAIRRQPVAPSCRRRTLRTARSRPWDYMGSRARVASRRSSPPLADAHGRCRAVRLWPCGKCPRRRSRGQRAPGHVRNESAGLAGPGQQTTPTHATTINRHEQVGGDSWTRSDHPFVHGLSELRRRPGCRADRRIHVRAAGGFDRAPWSGSWLVLVPHPLRAFTTYSQLRPADLPCVRRRA